jgi:long-chain fatty acid transport protein
MQFKLKATAAALGAFGAFTLGIGQANAAGFQLLEQNASGLGNAYSGTAALADNASTIFFNPAGMTYIPGMQVSVSVDAIDPSAKFQNTGSAISFVPGAGGVFNNGGDAGGWGFAPALYLTYMIDPKWSVGASFNAPFGLKTEYDAPWIGATLGIKSELKTYSFGLSGAYKATDTISIGGGVSYTKADATLTSAAIFPSLRFGTASLEGNDWAWSWNIGGLVQLTPDLRLGASYRSQTSYTIEGNISAPFVPPQLGGPVFIPASADLTTPGILTMSAVYQLTDKWQLMADVAWTEWSKFENLTVTSLGRVVQNNPENWQDTWRFAVGANYQINDQWKLRLGTAYDQGPVPGAINRTVRIPDNNRFWLAIGGQYKFTPKDLLDFGYAHLFINDASINQPAPGYVNPLDVCFIAKLTGVCVSGTYAEQVDILGLQYTHSF